MVNTALHAVVANDNQQGKVVGEYIATVLKSKALAIIDRLQQDFTKNGQTYDAIIDAVGKTTFRRSRRSLKPGGVFVATDGLENLLVWAAMRLVGRKRLRFASGRRSREDVQLLKQLIESGQIRPVLWRTLGFDVLSDLNGDGRPDIVVGRSRVTSPVTRGPIARLLFSANEYPQSSDASSACCKERVGCNDGKITLHEEECLGVCDFAPAVLGPQGGQSKRRILVAGRVLVTTEPADHPGGER
mgnify:CR=1 FL=1